MNQRPLLRIGLALFVVSATACSAQSGATLPAFTQSSVASSALARQSNVRSSCGALRVGDDVRCFALQRTDIGDATAVYFPGRMTATAVSGYGPADLQSAYNFSASGGAGQTVAVVDAYDNPSAEADLNVYRAHFGLGTCVSSNRCFKKFNQKGVTANYPLSDPDWGQEISLDLDMVSAACPKCHIILIEARSASNVDLATAVNTAVAKGANIVSNSYGGRETVASNAAYAHPGVVLLASAGDKTTGPQQPCSYSTVVCVGGTTLNHFGGGARGWSETVWVGTGSGCSAVVAKPAWQHDVGCANRSESDVSAVSDPNTGVAVYDSYGIRGRTGWLVFGGTSVATPFIAGLYALAGNAAVQNAASGIWSGAGANFFDVTTGSNGNCTNWYICNAGVGYDGPTGWGTPNGTAAF